VANLNQFAVLNNIKTQVLSYDKDSGTKRGAHSYLILCQCECGELFQTTVACFLRDKKWRCDVCSKSKSTIEYAVEQEIKKYTRDYISQYHTKNCINPATGYYLYFDFFVPSINCILEVDGEQHFEPRNLNGVTEEKAIDIFKYTKNHDNIKNKYCDDFGIKICRISYKQVNDLSYKQIICSLFNKT
jgi:very-short-patch-repair endonuclease